MPDSFELAQALDAERAAVGATVTARHDVAASVRGPRGDGVAGDRAAQSAGG